MLRTMLSVTLTVLRGVSTRYSICIADNNLSVHPKSFEAINEYSNLEYDARAVHQQRNSNALAAY